MIHGILVFFCLNVFFVEITLTVSPVAAHYAQHLSSERQPEILMLLVNVN